MAILKTRSEAEKKEAGFNYFIALGIPVNSTSSEITKAIQEFGAKILTTSDLQKKRLGELQTDIKEILINDAVYDESTMTWIPNKGSKKLEINAAKEFIAANIKTLVIYLVVRGFVYKSELVKIAKNNNIKYEEVVDIIAYLLEPKGKATLIDDSIGNTKYDSFAKICNSLQLLGKSNLYEFYGVTEKASNDEIRQAQASLSAKYKALSDAKSTAAKDLLSTTNLSYLIEQDKKKDYSLLIATKSQIWDQLVLLKANQIAQTTMEKKLEFITILLHNGLNKTQAEQEFAGIIKHFGIKIVSDQSKDVKICPFCGDPYLDNGIIKKCPSCGKELTCNCWNCGKEIKLDKSNVCTNCKALISDEQVFNKDIKQLNDFYTMSKNEEYISKFNSFKKYYLSNNKIGSRVEKELCANASKVKKIQEDLTSKQILQRNFIEKINNLISSKEYFTAMEVVKKASKDLDVSIVQGFLSTINNVINQAKKVYQTINFGNEQSIITSYKSIVAICVDYSEANELIIKYPPVAPQSVIVKINADANEIMWKTENIDANTSFTILRKIGSAPQNKQDGEILKTGIRTAHILDNTAKNATPYFYGVFSTRFGAHSKQIALTECVQRLSDVCGVKSKVLDAGLEVSWDKVDGAKEIIVCRSNNAEPPKSQFEGTKIAVDENGFIDKTLKIPGLYGYFIVCKYINNGTVVYSKGFKKTFEFFQKPSFIDKVIYEENGVGNYTATFSNLKVGKFDIFASLTPKADFKQNVYYSVERLKNLIEIDCQNMTSTSVDFSLPSLNGYYVYPVCIEKNEFTVGKCEFLVKKEAFKDVKIGSDNGISILKFNWENSAANYAVITVGRENYEKNVQSNVIQRISKKEYNEDGGFKLNKLAKQKNYVKLYAEFINDDASSFIESFETIIDKRDSISVEYSISINQKKGEIYVDFSSEQPATLENLIIVGAKKRPLTKVDGNFIANIEKVELKKKIFSKTYSASYKISSREVLSTMIYAIFFADNQDIYRFKRRG